MDLLSNLNWSAFCQAGFILGLTFLWSYCVSGVYMDWRTHQ